MLNLILFYNFCYSVYYFKAINYRLFIQNSSINNISNNIFFNFFQLSKKDFFLTIENFFLFKKNINLNDFFDLYKNSLYSKNYILHNYDFGIKLKNIFVNNDDIDEEDECEEEDNYSFLFPNIYFTNNGNFKDKDHIVKL